MNSPIIETVKLEDKNNLSINEIRQMKNDFENQLLAYKQFMADNYLIDVAEIQFNYDEEKDKYYCNAEFIFFNDYETSREEE
ncbi:MAG: hypothetical protein ACLFPL_03855 [Candidatus Nanoarchaeia archaeon]